MSHRTNPHRKPGSSAAANPRAAKSERKDKPQDKPGKPGAGSSPAREASRETTPRASPSPRDTAAGNDSDALQGEGNYTAARRYDEDVRDFVSSGRVEEAARGAAPRNADEERAMGQAEEAGRAHAKEEDPSVPRDYRR
ncbi:hypothetical protein HLB44_14345 [Aquincola sp. S2]|uniref:Uncharacterized protein n=1 Tax=Pseudaquabacterium terrae TaxID=2732868 RepID=A0ABX2EHU3_9BURK|nr:hypothetical protein [Aquabacterium terrae]NRF68170.1 hypothetical protein [Aquabacterium terrae]